MFDMPETLPRSRSGIRHLHGSVCADPDCCGVVADTRSVEATTTEERSSADNKRAPVLYADAGPLLKLWRNTQVGVAIAVSAVVLIGGFALAALVVGSSSGAVREERRSDTSTYTDPDEPCDACEPMAPHS
jgi:hypothetical protein